MGGRRGRRIVTIDFHFDSDFDTEFWYRSS
jgi:hypothetical protein